jgi:uncharacterized protein YjbI with pentapeptide repeats
MSKRSANNQQRFCMVGLIVGLIVGLMLSVSGIALAGNSAPTSINTCTKVSKHGVYGKTKVTTGTSCPTRQYFQSWTGSAATGEIASLQSQNAALSVYKTLLGDSENGAPSMSYANANFNDLSLPVAGLNGADFSGAVFTGAVFSTGVLGDVVGGGSSWQNDNFTNSDFGVGFVPKPAVLAFGNFSGSNFTGAPLVQAFVPEANFTGANLFFANFTNALIEGDNFTNANLSNANFTGATQVGQFSGPTFSNTTCPNGTNSNNDGGTCHGQGGGL